MLTLIDFFAEWCGPCHAMDPIFEEIKGSFSGKIDFKKVDVEEDVNMASEYGVMSIPTFVILKEGKEIDRKIGAMPKDILVSWLNSKL